MFIYTHPQYPRKPLERAFKYAYVITSLLNFSAFLITVNEFAIRLTTTYTNFWSNDELQLSTSLSELLDNCTTTADISINGKKATTTIGTETLEYIFLAVTALCIGIFVIHGLFIATDFSTKVLYTFNIRNFRIRGLIIRFTWIQPFWLLLYSVFAWSLIIASSSTRTFLQEYVDLCANRLFILERERYVEREIDKDVVFGINFTFIFVAIGINMFVYLCALAHLTFYGCRRRNKILAQYELPWERGCLGIPHKPMVTAWNGAREALADALVRGSADHGIDVQVLENTVNFPARYLDYFARLDANEVIGVTLGPDDVDNAAVAALGGGGGDGDALGSGEFGVEQGSYYPGGDGFEPESGVEVLIGGDDDGRRRRKHRKHRSSRGDTGGADAAGGGGDGAVTSGAGEDGGVTGEEGEERRRHRRKSRKSKADGADPIESGV